MKRLLPILVFLAVWMLAWPAWSQTVTATTTFTDPNTGAQAVDGVKIDRSTDGGTTWTSVTTLAPGVLTYSESVAWSASLCYQGTPFNTAGNGPPAVACQAGVKVPPGALQSFTLIVK